MIQRAQALILLLIMATSCLTQGMTLVQCRRTGQFYLGAAPEAEGGAGRALGCPACRAAEAAADDREHAVRVNLAAKCFEVVSTGAPPISATLGKTQAPELVLVAVAAAPFMGALLPRAPLEPQGRLRELWPQVRPPPGATRVVLYGALRI